MLEHPSIRWYSFPRVVRTGSSDNPSGADNQQETASAGSSETARQALLFTAAGKIQSDPHGDMRSQAEMTWPRSSDMDGRSNNMPKVAKFLVG